MITKEESRVKKITSMLGFLGFSEKKTKAIALKIYTTALKYDRFDSVDDIISNVVLQLLEQNCKKKIKEENFSLNSISWISSSSYNPQNKNNKSKKDATHITNKTYEEFSEFEEASHVGSKINKHRRNFMDNFSYSGDRLINNYLAKLNTQEQDIFKKIYVEELPYRNINHPQYQIIKLTQKTRKYFEEQLI